MSSKKKSPSNTFGVGDRHLAHETERLLHPGDSIVGYHSTSPYRRRADHPQWDVEISQRRRTWFGAYDPSAYVPEKNKEGVDIDVSIDRQTKKMFAELYRNRVANVNAADATKKARQHEEHRRKQLEEERRLLAKHKEDLKTLREAAKQRAEFQEEKEKLEAERLARERMEIEARKRREDEAREERELLERAVQRASQSPPRLDDTFFHSVRARRYEAVKWNDHVSADGSRRPRPEDEERVLCINPAYIAFPNAGSLFNKVDWTVVDGNEFYVKDQDETTIRVSILPSRNILVVFEPVKGIPSWVEYAPNRLFGSTELNDAFFGTWIARFSSKNSDKIDTSRDGRHEIVQIDPVEGLIFRNANKIIGCDRWQINDSESFSVKPLNGSKGWSHNVTLLRREKGVMKIVFGSNDLSAPWIEYVDASDTLSARAQEEVRKRLEEEKRRLEELETKREAERRREEEQKAMFDAMHLASTTKLPDEDEEEEHQEKVTAFTLMEEDENEKKENQTQDNEKDAEQHGTLLISKIQDDKKNDDLDADGFKHFRPKAESLQSMAERLREINGVGMIMTPGGTLISHGEEVAVRGGKRGFVQYVGYVRFKPGLWVGIEMNNVSDGKNDGSVDGTVYFITNPGRGLFVRPWNLRIVGEHNTHGKRLLTKKWKLFIDPNTGHRYYFNDDKAERATAGYSHAKTNSPSTAKLSSKRVATIVRRASFKARQALRQLSQDDMMKIFNEADPKGTGMLDKEEFAVACRAVNEAITEQEANVVFDYLDINHDDAINFYEFINFAHNPEDPVHRIKKTTDPEGHEHFLNSTMF